MSTPLSCSEAALRIACYTGGQISPDLEEHLQSCQSCRRIMQAMNEHSQPVTPDPKHVQDVKAALLEGLRPVKPLPSPQILFFTLAVLLFTALSVGGALFGIRNWESLALQTRASIFGPLLFAGCMLALAVVRHMTPSGGKSSTLAIWSVAAFAVVVATVFSEYSWLDESGFVQRGLKCHSVGLIYVAAAGLVSWLVIRRGALLSGITSGAIGGGLAGLVGIAGIELRCPSPNLAHILAWHLPLVLVGILAGLAIGAVAQFLRFRAYS